jgi:DinB superfamily
MRPIRPIHPAALIAAVAALAAAPAVAQEPMTDGAKAYLVDAFQRAKAWDISLAEAIPDSAMTWAPQPDVRNFAQQVIHAANNLFIAEAVFGTEGPAFGDEDALVADKAALVAAVGAGYDWIIERLEAMPTSALGEETEFFGRSMSRARVFMFALEHAMWTRGQLVPYLHAHGVAVPLQRLF